MSRKFKRIRTLLYGDQRFRSTEIDLLHTPALQRLYDLHQLGLTDRVYVDASHARLHHVIGVMEQADKLCEALRDNLSRCSNRVFKVFDASETKLTLDGQALAGLVEKRTSVIRLIGLLHDLTHAPYGHTVEDEIELVIQVHAYFPLQTVFRRRRPTDSGGLPKRDAHDRASFAPR